MALIDNIVSYYKFDSGALTTDALSANTLTNNGTVAGTASGKIGFGADFSTTNSGKYFSCAASLVTTDKTTAAYTTNIWINPSSFNNNDSTMFFGLCTNTKIRSKLGVFWDGSTSTKLTWSSWNGSGGETLNGTEQFSNITLSTWNMFSYTMNGTALSFYLNGVAAGTATVTLANGVGEASAFAIGRGTADNGNYTQGLGDEAGVWSRVLSGAEITSLYNAGAGNQYPFTEGGSTTSNLTTLNAG